MENIIGITGTPGVGKTTISKKLKNDLNYNYLSIKKLVSNKKLYDGVKNASKIVDLEEINNEINKEIHNQTIIDGHLSHLVDTTDLVIVLRLEPLKLLKRLKERRKKNISEYPVQKVRENVEAELMGVCINQALNRKDSKRIIEINTTNKSIEKVKKMIQERIRTQNNHIQEINWLNPTKLQKINQNINELKEGN